MMVNRFFGSHSLTPWIYRDGLWRVGGSVVQLWRVLWQVLSSRLFVFVYICDMSSVCICCGCIWGFFLYLLSPFIKYPVASNTLIFFLLLYMHIIFVQLLQYTCISSPNVFWICILEPPALLYDCIMIMHKSHVFDSFLCMCPCTNLYICWNVFFNASHCKSIDALFTLYEFFKMQSHFLAQYCVCL